MTILISKYKTGIDLPPLTTSLNHLSGENNLTFPYKTGDNQQTFSTTSGVHLCLVNGGKLILTDDTDTFTVAFGSTNISITWHSRVNSLADVDDVVFVFNAFAKPTSGITRLKFVATSGQTIFSGNDANGTALTVQDNSIQVFKNDNFLDESDYVLDIPNNTVTLTAPNAATAGDIVSMFVFASISDTTELNNATTSATASATTAGNHSTTAQRWASNPVNTTVIDANTSVDSNEYSAKAYAVGDNQTGGSAKEWAIGGSGNVNNAVEGTDFSAKYYATQGNVATVAANINSISDVAANETNINAVKNNETNINAVAGVVNNNQLQTVATNIADIQTAANDLNEATSEIDTVANSITNVDNVGNNINDVTSVAGALADIATVNPHVTNIGTVATNINNVNTVGNDIGNVNAVSSNAANINTVATDISNVNTSATNINNINTVANNVAAVTNVSTNMSSVTTALSNVNAFNQLYHGALSSDPSSNVTSGDLYFNTTDSKLKVYNGSAFVSVDTTEANDLSDVTITSPQNGQILEYNGAAFVNTTPTPSVSAGFVIAMGIAL